MFQRQGRMSLETFLKFYSFQLSGRISRFLNTSCSINYQLASTKPNECPMSGQKSNRDPKELHCTLEEWESGKPFEELPGPKPLPIIGNTWRFLPRIGEYGDITQNVLGVFSRLQKSYGNIVKLQNVLGMRDCVYLFNPEDIEKVYKLEGVTPERDILPSMSYFRKNMRQDIFSQAKGLLTSHGEEWYDFRNKVNPIMMQPKMVKQYIQPIDNIAKELVDRIKLIRGNDNKLSVNFLKELNKWALESIAYVALDSKLGCLQGDLPEDSIPAKMIKITEEVFIYSAKLDFEPSPWKYISTPTYRKTMKLYSDQVTMNQTLIENAMKNLNDKNTINNENQSESVPSVLERLLKIDRNVAIVMVLDMLLAGVDTTSTALINVLYYLAAHKSKQERLREEIKSLLPEEHSVVTAEILNSMPYLKACIKEAARLYPVTPGTLRCLTKDVVLSGYRIPKGTDALFPHMHLSLQESQFPRPNEFIPERWLRENVDSDISYKKAHPFCSMHFGFGSRSCIGRRFAELELELAVTNFIRYMDLTWDGPPPKRYVTTINNLSGPFNFSFEDVKST